MSELVLFPLRMVLFPGMSLDLQIFEQRYLRLITRCLREQQSFGVVGIVTGGETASAGDASEIYQVGTAVHITDWSRLDNGLLGIRVRGERRFRVKTQWRQEDGLLCARVEWFADEPELEIGEDYLGLRELLEDLSRHAGATAFGVSAEAIDASELGFALAQLLPLEDREKITLLEQTHPLERLELLIDRVADMAQS